MRNQKSSYRTASGFAASVRRLVKLSAVALSLAAIVPLLPAQSDSFPVGLPARAPGYDHYYQSEQASTAFATRWGYFDGYQDGKHDRELGIEAVPANHDRYKLAPDHGYHPEIPRAKYKTIYREAYLHGYDYGSKF